MEQSEQFQSGAVVGWSGSAVAYTQNGRLMYCPSKILEI